MRMITCLPLDSSAAEARGGVASVTVGFMSANGKGKRRNGNGAKR
jgi:hypothetical protein